MSEYKLIRKKMKTINTFAKQNTKKSSPVHPIILERSFNMLNELFPQSGEIIRPMMKYMLHVVKKPDNKGDRENGAGKHYYCAVSTSGKENHPIGGYYTNGLDKIAPSARTMFEEDYTMALTMYKAGFIKQSASYLGRAVHMLSDMCCMPHATGMTYFSAHRNFHKAYENLAALIYPDLERAKDIKPEQLDIFSDRSSFSSALNNIVESIGYELNFLFFADIRTIISAHLSNTEITVAALLKRFCEDIELSPEEAHYIVNGMECRLCDELPALYAEVTEKGIVFKQNYYVLLAHISKKKVCGNFTVAHRKNGLFTISYIGENTGRVLKYDGSEWPMFDPKNKRQFFKFAPKSES